MKKIGIIFSVLTVFSLSSYADVFDYPSSAKNVSLQIPVASDVKCRFKREKYVKTLAKPLISTGDFEFVKNKGVVFYTKYPVESVADYTGKSGKVNDIINTVASGRYSKIEKEFDLYFTGNSSDWVLGIKPKKNSEPVKYISSITAEGKSEFINKITINQTDGNKTVLWFTK